MADPTLDDLERRLLRGVLVRRLVIGIGAVALGIVLLVMCVVTARMSFRLLRTSIAMAIFGVAAIVGGFVTLRVGEIRADLAVHDAEPVPWKTIALAMSAVAVVAMLLAAWPMGVYRWLGTLRSPCRALLAPRDVSALSIAPFDVAHVEDQASMCALTGVEPGGDRRVVAIEMDGPRSGYRFEDRVRPFRATSAPALFERHGEWLIALQGTKGAVYVHLASARYDASQAERVAMHVRTKLDLLDRFPDR